ncbi:lytic transglycosylase [Staphylococcus phage Twort]|uniref:Lytic transglycosylase n=1 Tax=Staphylococcus phage Twort (strain DSM 17442 / HER 48) TaxID=2908167 RepID=A0A6H0X5F1_BPTWO|nr:lytic transglycosylase [Staphylococcus phage Twort]
MKKTILASLVLGTALTFGGISDKASADEIDYATLANKAQTNSEDLVTKPIQEGNYDFSFVLEGFTYHFYSYNGYFGYDYHQGTDGQVNNTSSQLASLEQNNTKNNVEYTTENKEQHTQPITIQEPQNKSTQVGTVKLGNGNTTGETGLSASKEMEARTGVPASTWEAIIARESNGQVNAQNPSGARGLFQTMPGWGSTATVQDQINSATKAYKAQGLSAWGM